jgi:hypothetical protein
MKKYRVTVDHGVNEEIREGTALYFYDIADRDCMSEFDCHLDDYLDTDFDAMCDQSLMNMAIEYFSMMFNFPEITVEAI